MELPPSTADTWTTLMYVDVPAGSYLVNVTENFQTVANLFGQDNSRKVECGVRWGLSNFYYASLAAMSEAVVSPSAVATLTAPGRISFDCQVVYSGSDRSYVYAEAGTMSALKLGALN
jgi:hypothetical protein